MIRLLPRRQTALERWRRSLDRQVAKQSRKLINHELSLSRTPRKLKVEAHGAERQRAWMMAGWSPLSDSGGLMTLTIDLPTIEI